MSLAVALAGCAQMSTRQMALDEEPVVTGPAARRNSTPLEPAFGCLAQVLRERKYPLFGVAVGDVKDYTGKYSQNEGSTITQGGALMIYSALGKLGDVVQVQERFDTRIAELELAYTDKRQLGDGRTHNVEAGKPAVPWVPYFGGSILRSNFYIVGGITELNYNIGSGGVEVAVNGVGVKRRTFTMNVGVDLRIVDTRTLVVAKTVSLQKQIVGHEIGGGVYRFFGASLVDINVGSKSQEPLQLGVRTTIEQGVLELIASITGVDPQSCLTEAADRYRAGPALDAPPPAVPVAAAKPVAAPPAAAVANGKPAAVPQVAARAAVPAPAAPQAAVPITPDLPQSAPLQNAMASPQSAAQAVLFEFGSSSISAQAGSTLERLASEAAQGLSVTFHLVARDNEIWTPMQRRELTNQRMRAVTDLLAAKGISQSRVGVAWMAAPTDSAITRHGAGYQLVATMVIAR